MLLPRTRRHLYVLVEPDADRVIALALWGGVRGTLPRLRRRLAERDTDE